MEPVIASAIINGILCGAASGVSTVATTELVEAYRKLRGLLQKKFGQDSILLRSIGNLEQRPESKTKQAGVVEDAAELRADKDAEIVKAAEALLALVKKQPGGNVQGNVFTNSGSGEQNIAQGAGAIGKQVNAQGAQIGVLGDNAKLKGGIHFGDDRREEE